MAMRVVNILATIVNESYSSHGKAKGQRLSLCIVGAMCIYCCGVIYREFP